ncbi:MAG: RnfABCDGE type electron transport complex subunit G [Calditrichia bacterium]
MNNIFRLSIILAIVTAVAAYVLAEIYGVTKPQIELQKKAKTRQALNEVMAKADTIIPIIQQVPVTDSDGNVLYEKDRVAYYVAYKGDAEQDTAGYAFMAYGNGYSSVVETMVGIDTAGRILSIEVISQKETPGLGALVVEDGAFQGKKWTTRQFEGKTADDLKVDKDGGEIVSITGATITSRAVTNSIRERMQELLPELGITGSENNGGQ